jgi:hypothetical protein
MSLFFIRLRFGVPARLLARISFLDRRGRVHDGMITGSRADYLRAWIPSICRDDVTIHPTSNVRYQAEMEGAA